jgi:LmbE family N-acetylglucosaminyl deacetylase
MPGMDILAICFPHAMLLCFPRVPMRKLASVVFALLVSLCFGQTTQPTPRFKTDILLLVAHPDDDTAVSSYLARAIFDQNQRVAVVYCTRGDAGGNAAGREHAKALGAIREMEGRRALATLGITNVWFLDGRDTPSQNVLASLGNWPHGRVLEQAVRIMRLTRPEVVLTWLPSSVVGENHGDHQAAAVIATEAFDLAGSPVAFPAQIAAPLRTNETALEGLSPWQPKKLYYFSDAFDDAFLTGKGPAYSIKEISPFRKVSYAQVAVEEFGPYYSQSPDPKMNQEIETGEGLAEIVSKATKEYFSDPLRLMLGKSLVKASVTGDLFEGINPSSLVYTPPRPPGGSKTPAVQLGGTWGFYREFWAAHELSALGDRPAEIAVRPEDVLTIPLELSNSSSEPKDFNVSLNLPPGWTIGSKQMAWMVPPQTSYPVAVQVKAPALENKSFQEIQVVVQGSGIEASPVTLRVQVRSNVFSQLH